MIQTGTGNASIALTTLNVKELVLMLNHFYLPTHKWAKILARIIPVNDSFWT